MLVAAGRASPEAGRFPAGPKNRQRKVPRADAEALALQLPLSLVPLDLATSYWVGTREAARILGVHGSRVGQLVESGRVPCVRHVSGRTHLPTRAAAHCGERARGPVALGSPWLHALRCDPLQVPHTDTDRVPDERPPVVSVTAPCLEVTTVPEVFAFDLDWRRWVDTAHAPESRSRLTRSRLRACVTRASRVSWQFAQGLMPGSAQVSRGSW